MRMNMFRSALIGLAAVAGVMPGAATAGPLFAGLMLSVADSNDSSYLAFAAADVDGDGDIDFYGNALNTNRVERALHRNIDDNLFVPEFLPISNPSWAYTLFADVDSDGDPDLVAGVEGGVAVLVNDGTGAFGPQQNYVVSGAQDTARDIGVSDLDGDGDVDIVFSSAQAGAGSVHVLLQAADGTFADSGRFVFGTIPNTFDLGDLDGDGDTDIAVAVDGAGVAVGNLSVLRNNGDGTFAAPVSYTAGSRPRDIALGDMDNDGDLDVVLAGNSTNITVYRNPGNGTFPNRVLTPVTKAPSLIRLGDLNGDGLLDVIADAGQVFPNPPAGLVVLLNLGNGNLGGEMRHWEDQTVLAAIVVDFDRDGDEDLIVEAYPNTGPFRQHVMLNNGDASFDTPRQYAAAPTFPRARVADLNGDGRPDVITVNTSVPGVITVLMSNPSGSFEPEVYYDIEAGGMFHVVDIDRDADADVIIGSRLGYQIWKNMGNGLLQTPTLYPPPLPGSSAPWYWDVVDADTDGDIDLVSRTVNRVCVTPNNGDGTFEEMVCVPMTLGASAIAFGDMDGDGDQDLVSAGILDSFSGGDSVVYIGVSQNDGSGVFGEPVYFNLRPADVFRLGDLSVGDLDNDGDLDVVLRQRGGHKLTVAFNDGSGLLYRHVIYGDFLDYSGGESTAVVDVNLDGSLDIVVNVHGAQWFIVYLNRGDGDFDGAAYTLSETTNAKATRIAAADLDLDSDVDVIGVDGGVMTVVENQLIVGPVACPADLTGDGQVDSGDLAAFIGAFLESDVAADLTGDGQVDSGDLAVFIDLFLNGCGV